MSLWALNGAAHVNHVEGVRRGSPGAGTPSPRSDPPGITNHSLAKEWLYDRSIPQAHNRPRSR
jgi:hypothetical protein